MSCKKIISVILATILCMSDGFACKAATGVCQKMSADMLRSAEADISELRKNVANANDKIANVKGDVVFVPDEKITIDSSMISSMLDIKWSQNLSAIHYVGRVIGQVFKDLFDYLFSSSEKKRLKFVSPDKNSSNPLSRELFPNGSPKPEDVKQGKLGLCYFFAVLSTVAEKNPELIKNNLTEDGNGNVIVKFFNPSNGSPYYVKVQKTVPQLPEAFKFLSNDCLWVHMYLKAFIASGFSGVRGYLVNGLGKKNYKYAEFGYMDLVMRMITGKNTEIKNALSVWISNKEKLYKKIEKTLSESCCITCDFSPHLNVVKQVLGATSNEGLVRGHAYSIERVYKDKDGQKWIVIRNPWGDFVSTYDKNGKRVLSPCDNDNKGYSVLKFEDFLSMCGKIYFCKNESIKERGIIKRVLDFLDPVPLIIQTIEVVIIKKIIDTAKNNVMLL